MAEPVYQKRMTPDNPDYPGEKGVADRLKHYDDQISGKHARWHSRGASKCCLTEELHQPATGLRL